MPKTPVKAYQDGAYIVREGDAGDCMYFIQAGEVEVVRRSGGREIFLAVLAPGDFFGEMALLEGDVRSASVRSIGESQIVSLDKASFLQRIQQEPSLAFRIFDRMAERVRDLSERLRELGGAFPDEKRAISLDKKAFLAEAQKDPRAAFRTLGRMSRSVRELDNRLSNMCSLHFEEGR